MKILLNFIKCFLIATGVYMLFVFFEIGGSYIQEAGFLGGLQNTWYLITANLTNLVLFSSLMSMLFIAKKNPLKKSLVSALLAFIIMAPLLYFYSNSIETELGKDAIIIRMENTLGEKFSKKERQEKRKALAINRQYQSVKELSLSIDSLDEKISGRIQDLEKVTKRIPDSSLNSEFDPETIHKYDLTGKKKEGINLQRLNLSMQRLDSQLIQINFIEKKQREFEFEKYSRFTQLIMLFYLLVLGALAGNKLSDQRLVSMLAVGILIMTVATYFVQMAQRYYIDNANLLAVIFYGVILIGLLLYFLFFCNKRGTATFTRG